MKQKKSLHSIRAAVGMAIATLLTTCLIGGSFAKYVNGAGDTVTAHVAYWGFGTIGTIDLQDLFSSSYTNVQSATGDNIIAPGTEGSVEFSFPFNNGDRESAPEVAYRIDVQAEGYCESLIQNNPGIRFRLDNGAYGTWEQLLASLKALSGDASGSKVYAAGELPAAFGEGTSHTIYWKWEFTDSADPATRDAIDTELGNWSDTPNIELIISVTATQID